MTTFHELLGTSAKDTTEKVKQRYKLLSLRVHPDKEGTSALMYLVHHAYENVRAGRGHHKLSLPNAENIYEQRIVAKLQQENVLLKSRIKQLEAEPTRNNVQSEQEELKRINYQLIKTIQQLEKQVSMHKNERRHLLLRKEAEQAEKLKLAKELKRVLLENQLQEGHERQQVSSQVQWVANITLLMVLMCLLLLSINYFY